jgi:hypothetical protein
MKDIFPMNVERVRRRSHMPTVKSREFKIDARFRASTLLIVDVDSTTASGP